MDALAGALADLADLYARHHPERLVTLRPPASIDQVAALERAVGVALPAEITTWFAWRDGQHPGASPLAPTTADAPGYAWLPAVGRALSADEARRRLEQRRGDADWQPGWLPLFLRAPTEASGAPVDVVYDLTAGAPARLRFGLAGEPWHGLVRPTLAAWVSTIASAVRGVFGPWSGEERVRRRVLATTAVTAVRLDAWWDVLGHWPRPAHAANAYTLLTRDWEIFDVHELERVLTRLDVPPDAPSFAWDQLRRASLAGWAHAAGLIDAARAWAVQLGVARATQIRYPSWRAAADAYRDGLRAWGAALATEAAVCEDHDRAVATLTAAPWSPWHQLDWAAAIDDVASPVLAGRVRHALDADELQRLLDDAEPGDVIELAAGTYRGAFRSGQAVTLRPAPGAAGGVCLESDGTGATLRADAGLEVHELAIVNSSGAPGQKGDAVALREAAVVLERCVLSATSSAVRTLGAWAYLAVRGGELRDVGETGVLLLTGRAYVGGATIRGCAGNALQLGDKGRSLTVEACVIEGGRASAAALFAAARLQLRACRLQGHPRPQVGATAGEARLLGCELVAGASAGVYATGAATTVTIAGGRLADHGAAHVQVEGGAVVSLADALLEGGAWTGVSATRGAGVELARTRVVGTTKVALYGEAATIRLEDVVVEAPREGGGAYLVGGTLVGRGLVVARAPVPALEVAGGATAAVRDLVVRDGTGAVHVGGGSTATVVGVQVDGGSGDAVHVRDGGRLRGRGVDVRGGARGVVVGTGGRALLQDVTARDLRGAADGPRSLAALVGEGGVLAIVGGQLAGPLAGVGGDSIVQAISGGLLVLERVALEGGHGALVSRARAVLWRCALAGSRTAALEAKEGARVSLVETTADGSRFAAIECHRGAAVTLLGCELVGGESAVLCHAGGEVTVHGGGRAGGHGRDDLDGGRLIELLCAAGEVEDPLVRDAYREVDAMLGEGDEDDGGGAAAGADLDVVN